MDHNYLRSAIDELSKEWEIDKRIYDLTLGRRNDVKDTAIQVNEMIFHIPTLTNDNLYVLWDCLWPRCHNCCDKQGRLPLTIKDIEVISENLHYTKKEFIELKCIFAKVIYIKQISPNVLIPASQGTH